MVVMLNGITVVLQFTMLLIWAMLGKEIFISLCELPVILPNSNYVTQDVLRRIMSDYFGYDVHFVMNITDIDDKVRACVSIVLSRFHILPLRSSSVLAKTILSILSARKPKLSHKNSPNKF